MKGSIEHQAEEKKKHYQVKFTRSSQEVKEKEKG
jgi:hypothetical protein